MENSIIVRGEKIGLFISIVIIVVACVLELCGVCWVKTHTTIISSITGLACGFVATIIVLYLERNYEKKKLQFYYQKYAGSYKRIDIGQDNTPDQDLVNIRNENNDLIIEMTYLGGHEFSLVIDYWKSEKAQARGVVEFNPKDKQSAKGNYRYIAGKSYGDHYGNLELNWNDYDMEMIVIYRHQYPRKIPFNPDNNRGWEVWKKISL